MVYIFSNHEGGGVKVVALQVAVRHQRQRATKMYMDGDGVEVMWFG